MPIPPSPPAIKYHSRSFEAAYVDAIEERRSVREVLAQIDGMGGGSRRRSIETRRRPGRKEVLMNEVSIEKTSFSCYSSTTAPATNGKMKRQRRAGTN
jgi:hypothetical protein